MLDFTPNKKMKHMVSEIISFTLCLMAKPAIIQALQ